MARLLPVVPPALPDPADQYRALSFRNLNNVLRLYFNRVVNSINALTGVNGGQYVECPNGLFFNTSEQILAAINTATPVVYNATYLSNAVGLVSGSTSKIEATVSGIYNFQFSGQLVSTNSSSKTMYLWIRRDGTDIGYSSRGYTLSDSNAYFAVMWSFNIDLQEGQYVELMCATTDTDLHFHAESATSPHTGIPSSVMSVNFISPLPDVLPTPPST